MRSLSLRGDHGFEYETLWGTPKLADRLPRVFGAGQRGVVPRLAAFSPDRELGELLLVPLVRELVQRGLGGELTAAYTEEGPFLPSSTLEFVQYAVGEQLVEVIRRLDAMLPEAATSCALWGHWGYRVAQADLGALLAHANDALPASARLTLAQVSHEARFAAASAALAPAHDGAPVTPHLALCLVRHARAHALATFTVEDAFPGVQPTNEWEVIREAAGDRFEDPPRDDFEMQFTRGVVFTFLKQKRDAMKALTAAHTLGDPRARRWLAVHGKTVPAVAKAAIRRAAVPAADPDEGARLRDRVTWQKALGSVPFDAQGFYTDPAKAVAAADAVLASGWWVGHEIRRLVRGARHQATMTPATRAAIVALGTRLVASAIAEPGPADDADDLPAAVAVDLAAVATAAKDLATLRARLADAALLGADLAAVADEAPFTALRAKPALADLLPSRAELAALRAVAALPTKVTPANVRSFVDPKAAVALLAPLAARRWIAREIATLVCTPLVGRTPAAVRARIHEVATAFVDQHAGVRGKRRRGELGYAAHCLACLDAVSGRADAAIAHLQAARAAGYDIAGSPTDPDFATIRTLPAFKALFKKR